MTSAQTKMILKNLFPIWDADIDFIAGCPCMYINPLDETDVTFWTAKQANSGKIPTLEPENWTAVDFTKFGQEYSYEGITDAEGTLAIYLTDDGMIGGSALFSTKPKIRFVQEFSSPPTSASEFCLYGYDISPDFKILTVYAVELQPVTILGGLPAEFKSVPILVSVSSY